ncbi:PspA/IM30 family protein [Paenibacillus senegalensis]|uniref:PspA/IM30 family protein n=1 Tax=Paenibacillus senegalensis TaxID=1465766 RepID=UPI000289F43A|nr:PspA/IM30 family protein [Paenibacillus senegalensis]
MGILARFQQIMKANVNARLDKTDDPEKAIDQYMRELSSDLGQVKAETEAILAAERRAKRALDESSAEMAKLQRYAERAVENGEESRALQFLERKAKQAEVHSEVQAAYDAAASNASQMRMLQEKLVSDMNKLEARRTELKGKLAEASLQQSLSGSASESFRQLEEKAQQAIHEAEALAELRAGKPEDDLDALLAQLDEKPASSPDSISGPQLSIEEELAKIKARLNK